MQIVTFLYGFFTYLHIRKQELLPLLKNFNIFTIQNTVWLYFTYTLDLRIDNHGAKYLNRKPD